MATPAIHPAVWACMFPGPAAPCNEGGSDDDAYEGQGTPATRLPFAVLDTDGGSFGQNYGVRNLVAGDSSVYSTRPGRSGDVHVLLEYHGPGASFTATSVTMAVPFTGFTSPLGQAILFASWDRPDSTHTQCWSDVHSEAEFVCMSRAWEAAGGAGGQGLRPPSPCFGLPTSDGEGCATDAVSNAGYSGSTASSVSSASSNSRRHSISSQQPEGGAGGLSPVAFIDMERSTRREVKLPIPRSGRYLLLKMLRPRGAYISPSSNLDVQLLEVRGWQGPAAFGTVAQPPAPPQRPLL